MTEDQNRIDANFFQLVVSLQMAAMQNMGKIASPLSGKIERNLDQAKVSIDMLAMLSEKMGGNLTREEEDLLDRALYELRMNFVDETKKDETKTAEKADEADSDKEEQETEPESESESEKSEGD